MAPMKEDSIQLAATMIMLGMILAAAGGLAMPLALMVILGAHVPIYFALAPIAFFSGMALMALGERRI